MASRISNSTQRDDTKLLVWIVVGFLFVAWLCTPPGNKFLQLCFWGNNTKYIVAKFSGSVDTTAYIFHRNNAVYLAKMYPDKKRALKEMDKAIKVIPNFAKDTELKSLYYDRASIRLMAGDYKGALSDFMNTGEISFNDNLKVAMLFKEVGNYRDAMGYCNNIINTDSTAYAGYACMSEIYSSLGRYDVCLNVWNLLIDRKPNSPRAYADRALIKKKMGDLEGYNNDIKKAKEYLPTMDIDESLTYNVLHPKKLMLSIKK